MSCVLTGIDSSACNSEELGEDQLSAEFAQVCMHVRHPLRVALVFPARWPGEVFGDLLPSLRLRRDVLRLVVGSAVQVF